ncbi:hypothetical protein V6N11_082588 [Hibiscus sabdariffa]|uniref:Uncharacterized protein n=1 Tax=Hibiscus sabdariffa TaxID=183260 RepID=A0ABR2N933_9ROSI
MCIVSGVFFSKCYRCTPNAELKAAYLVLQCLSIPECKPNMPAVVKELEQFQDSNDDKGGPRNASVCSSHPNSWYAHKKTPNELCSESILQPSASPLRNALPYCQLWILVYSSMMVAVATSSIPLHYVAQAWRGAAILSFVWFLHRWKANVLGRVVAAQNLAGIDRDKFSSVGLFVIGLMPLAGRSIGFLSWRKNVHCRTSARKLVIQLVDLPVNL